MNQLHIFPCSLTLSWYIIHRFPDYFITFLAQYSVSKRRESGAKSPAKPPKDTCKTINSCQVSKVPLVQQSKDFSTVSFTQWTFFS